MLKSTEKINDTIQTVPDLITILDEEERTKYTTILRKMELPISEFEKYATWSEDCYTRNCIAENENFELILICWNIGQKTPIHDHGGEQCWVSIVDGEFKENIYNENEKGELNVVRNAKMKSGDVTYMVDFMGFHNLENVSDNRSMSLDLYANPIKSCKVYDSKKGSFARKKLYYDTYQKLLNEN